MRDFRDSKSMAQTLRDALKARSVSLTHSESLELIAHLFGLHDWNTLAARIQASAQPAVLQAGRPTAPLTKPVIPLRDVVFFPQMVTPIFVARDKSRRALERALATDGLLFAVTQRRPEDDDPPFEALYRVGVLVSIISRTTLPDGTLKVFVTCLERRAMVRSVPADYVAADLATLDESNAQTAEALALSLEVQQAYQAYANVDFAALPHETKALFRLPNAGEPGALADSVAALIAAPVPQKQPILEATNVVKRLESVLDLIRTGSKAA